jgi:hypothetical protein
MYMHNLNNSNNNVFLCDCFEGKYKLAIYNNYIW